jgi:hypothetical protein
VSTFRGPEADNEGRESVVAMRVPIQVVRVAAGRESANRGRDSDSRS